MLDYHGSSCARVSWSPMTASPHHLTGVVSAYSCCRCQLAFVLTVQSCGMICDAAAILHLESRKLFMLARYTCDKPAVNKRLPQVYGQHLHCCSWIGLKADAACRSAQSVAAVNRALLQV